ncbi:MAG: phosphoadenosine phosphosulfate reductase family protein [Candidatus Methanomethylophilus sp.]|nr:phosphoadenosine phosphosulfate reductase family protein [Methanomethylophilus sp.]
MVPARTNIANGKEVRRWCDRCGTLLLGNKCSRCGSEGREFEINSPGDIRPCMGESIGILEDLFIESFGTAQPVKGKSVFFNKIPGEDRTDEIVAHGNVIGVLRFDIAADRLKVELRQAGAELFDSVATKNIVRIFGVSGHLKGKGVAGENVSEVIGEFGVEEPLILRKGQKVGPGVSMAPSGELKSAEKAVRVRDLNTPSGFPVSPDADRDTFVECNEDHLKSLEKTSVNEIKAYIQGRKQPVTVSFSGGKDSLAAYGITARAVKDPELLFTNTGLEFPETLEYVESFAKRNKLILHIAEAGTAFKDNVDTFGPPAKDFRWCCKVCKLGPISELISKTYPNGTITSEGNRSLESYSRADTGLVTRNPFVPNQINLNPVRDWCAAEIWGYIWMRGLDYNPLYERDFERIGCYLCASCLASEWRNTSRIHPDMYRDWEEYLHRYAERNGLPPEYIDMGFWRWKVLPPKMRQLAEGLDLRMEPKKGSGLSLKMMKGASVCVAGGYSMEAIVTIPRNRDFEYVEDALRTVGEVKYSPEFEIALAKMKTGKAKLFGGGQVSVTAEDARSAEKTFEKAVKALLRAELCTQCGICAKACPRKAIRIKGGMKVDPEKCISCGKCESSCMVVHYYDKIMAGKSALAPEACGTRPQQNTQHSKDKGKHRPHNRRPDSRKGGNRRR